MTDRILCVDDEPNILQAFQRALRGQFHIEIALGGEEALKAVIDKGPYAVVVSDMQMPGMTGVNLLKKVKMHAEDTVRMMLTGNADQQTALEAVNEGHIFRFLTKPCCSEITRAIRLRLRNFSPNLRDRSAIKVFMPQEMASLFAERRVPPASMRMEE